MSEENRKQLYIPEGFAHGFLSLKENTEIEYLCSDYYAPQYESGIFPFDSDLNIDWELEKYGLSSEELIISSKDKNLPSFKEFCENLKEVMR